MILEEEHAAVYNAIAKRLTMGTLRKAAKLALPVSTALFELCTKKGGSQKKKGGGQGPSGDT